MLKAWRLIEKLRGDEEGAALIEYTVLLGILVVAVIATIVAVGGWISNRWTAVERPAYLIVDVAGAAAGLMPARQPAVPVELPALRCRPRLSVKRPESNVRDSNRRDNCTGTKIGARVAARNAYRCRPDHHHCGGWLGRRAVDDLNGLVNP